MTAGQVAQGVAMGAMSEATVEFKVHFRNGDRGRRRVRAGVVPKPKAVEAGRIPRISRLMALAIHFDRMIREGVIRDYADVARLGSVSRARVSQVMHLLNLAPDIQEKILLLPQAIGRETVTERCLRGVVCEADWAQQRRIWAEVTRP